MSRINIVVDENMPGIEQLFGSVANISYVDGRNIKASHLAEADALLCRSITSVNSALLQGTPVKFVGTATIGTDHLDIDWLETNKIRWASAAGCNAAAVAQYVLSAASYWCIEQQRIAAHPSKTLQQLTFGIVGAGNVGSELARCLNQLNINYQLCDPPLENAGDPRSFDSMASVLSCDVITLHVPLTTTGPYPTEYLIGEKEMAAFSNRQLVINASRGKVLSNQALVGLNASQINRSNAASFVLDVFETEPQVPRQVIEQCLLSTPHIAGHTLEGKLRGSWLVYKAFCEAFGIKATVAEHTLYPEPNRYVLQQASLEERLLTVYDIRKDADKLSQLYSRHSGQSGHSEHSEYSDTDQKALAAGFDGLRKNANRLSDGSIRRDYSGCHFTGDFPLPLG